MAPSLVVDVDRAVAVGLADGPRAGLALLAPLLVAPALRDDQPLHAARAELLRRSGDRPGAGDAARRAIGLTAGSVQRAGLERRLGSL